ncbi:hypothetical protein CHUUTOTORO_00040 [Serratia phage vB_SmaM-ChuuTotoro]|nr:hypothetical protein CHUUTOTORO_00040 [Serratia phage vB_SmaM-ChuuTotoro]
MGSLVDVSDFDKVDVVPIDNLPVAGGVNTGDYLVVNKGQGIGSVTTKATLGAIFMGSVEESKSAAQEAARSALEAKKSAEDSAGLQKPYKDVTEAQKAIDAGELKDGDVFSVVGSSPNNSYEFFFNEGGTAKPILDTNGTPKVFPNFNWYLEQLKMVDFNLGTLLPNHGYNTAAGDNAFEIGSMIGQLALYLDQAGKLVLPSGNFNLGGGKFMALPEDSEYALAFSDDEGRVTVGIGKDGWVEVLGMRLYKGPDSGDCLVVSDDDGYVSAKISNTGQVTVYDGNGGTGNNPGDGFLEFVERLHIFIYGQSLSNGAIGTPVLGTPVSDALMYNTGVRSYNKSPTSLTPLHETQEGSDGETIASGLAHNFSRNSGGMYGRKLILNAGGVGGARIEEISKGTASYTQLVVQMRQNAERMKQEGREYSPDFNIYMQGEANMAVGTSKAEYMALQTKLYDDLNADTRSIRVSGLELVQLTYQTSSHGFYVGTPENPSEVITQAQLELALTHPKIDMWGPTYMGLPGNLIKFQGNVHHSNHGYRIQGCYAEKALRHRIMTRSAENPEGTKYLPLHARSAKKINDHVVIIDMHVPHPPLVFDSSLVKELADGMHGVELHDATGRLPVTDVEIVGGTKLRVTTSSTLGDGVFAAFAWTPENRGEIDPVRNRYADWFFGRETGVRTTIRDSDRTTTDLTGEDGNPYPLHNYCVIQKIEVTQ